MCESNQDIGCFFVFIQGMLSLKNEIYSVNQMIEVLMYSKYFSKA